MEISVVNSQNTNNKSITRPSYTTLCHWPECLDTILHTGSTVFIAVLFTRRKHKQPKCPTVVE